MTDRPSAPAELSSTSITPGLLVLHGNRAELLGEAVFEWLRRQPLGPLEEEIFLVQSNGVAEWLKMTLAQQTGICAATRVELPGRFLWRAYRQLLGRSAVPAESMLDKLPMTWRLMQLLPALQDQAGFEPLAGFLHLGGMERRLQLAQRLADLFDQYQVYRSDWLDAWGQGHDVLIQQTGQDPHNSPSLPADQRWQPLLWRALQEPLSATERAASRPQLHQRFVAALQAGHAPVTPMARRVVLFGMTHVPMQTLQALAALSETCQVLLAIPNPCRYHWADIIEGRELLKQSRRRQPLRKGLDLAELGLEAMHQHAHPLLASWGRQGRDFVRQLDAFDDALQAQERFAQAKIDLFDEGEGAHWLGQVQARIRDLVPLAEHEPVTLGSEDRSIVFHIAHGAQREVEILQDQLLKRLAEGGLQPRDIVVMVPDIDAFAPAIRSVFGQYGNSGRGGDKRFIPFDIADLKDRGHNPLMIALEWLLRLPQQRCRLSEVRDLLDVPGLAARFGLSAADLPRLSQWMEGAGIRWGLNEAQRADLGLAACGEQNSWVFGLRRILLGYAVGDTTAQAEPFRGIAAYSEVGGLDAALAGCLADLLGALQAWWELAATPVAPLEWAERGLWLMETFFLAQDDQERQTLGALQAAMTQWLSACDTAEFAQSIELPVAREAWLSGIDLPTLNRRFKAGGVTFCTLMPMRAVPFELVCLLGMNDGDYPRRSSRSDFDLMGLPGQQRPGDRSGRDDDRQLILEALLSARQQLYISWSGRSVRDNSEQPPSVLVSQLRDYLASGWGEAAVAARTVHHPLQPFSRSYFEVKTHAAQEQDLFTYAREWRQAHAQAGGPGATGAMPLAGKVELGSRELPLNLSALTAFLKNPVKSFFQQRLDVQFRDEEEALEDDEAFGLGGLEEWALLSELSHEVLMSLEALGVDAGDANEALLSDLIQEQTRRVQAAGRLPLGEMGRRAERQLGQTLLPMLKAWVELQSLFPVKAAMARLHFVAETETEAGAGSTVHLDDWLDGLQAAPALEQLVWLTLSPSRLCADEKCRTPRADHLLAPWLRSLVASACGEPALGVLVGRDAQIHVNPLPQEEAIECLNALLQTWQQGMEEPLPFAAKTALAFVADQRDVALVFEGGGFGGVSGEGEEACLARTYPDFAALSTDGRFEALARRLFEPMLQWMHRSVTLTLHSSENIFHD
ncbi:exodeoxyribonuclease V subunit gamma [Paucibacter sp. KCTC 42545]|uniref:exodeoxyribonuclease V subunit gamma n=1 Tax=Paucibacter sp. KCTC 42545 TaxID=1768242 RepID=UPI000733A6A9|nr:exodeoxyribonuclease V subunit gamma [Paucibacter sp. KCTC 42545]ALT79892.1 exodeoxyribonuclease V subunit gamma [Paucibacter sp. KCTC 42545]